MTTIKERLWDLLLRSSNGVTLEDAQYHLDIPYVSANMYMKRLVMDRGVLRLRGFEERDGRLTSVLLFGIREVIGEDVVRFRSLNPASQKLLLSLAGYNNFTTSDVSQLTGCPKTQCAKRLEELEKAGFFVGIRASDTGVKSFIYRLGVDRTPDDVEVAIARLPEDHITSKSLATALGQSENYATGVLYNRFQKGLLYRRRESHETGMYVNVYFLPTNSAIKKNVEKTYEFVIASCVLKYKNGLTLAQISKNTSISLKTVRSVVSKMVVNGVMNADIFSKTYAMGDDIEYGIGYRLLVEDIRDYAVFICRGGEGRYAVRNGTTAGHV